MYQFFGYLGVVISSYFIVRLILEFAKYRKKVTDILLTPTSDIEKLLEFKDKKERIVEVKGKVGTMETVVSPYTQTECAYYYSLEQEKVQKVFYKGQGENRKAYTKVVHRVVSEEKSPFPFYVEDETGLITIDPEGFELEGKVVFEEETPIETKSLEESVRPSEKEERTISKIKKEVVLLSDEKVYIIGELFLGEQSNFIGSDPFKNKTSLISINEEYSIVKKYAAMAFRRLAGVVLLIGVLVFLIRSLV